MELRAYTAVLYSR